MDSKDRVGVPATWLQMTSQAAEGGARSPAARLITVL